MTNSGNSGIHVYHNDRYEAVNPVTSPTLDSGGYLVPVNRDSSPESPISPTPVDGDGYLAPVNQSATVSQRPSNTGHEYESLEPVSPQPAEPMSDNTYQTLTVDSLGYITLH